MRVVKLEENLEKKIWANGTMKTILKATVLINENRSFVPHYDGQMVWFSVVTFRNANKAPESVRPFGSDKVRAMRFFNSIG